ncbi:General transcription factor IIH subunit 5, partial [Cyphomyrmex costatus]
VLRNVKLFIKILLRNAKFIFAPTLYSKNVVRPYVGHLFVFLKRCYIIFLQYYPGNLQKYIEVPIFSDLTKPSSTKACNTSLTACTTMFFSFGAIFSSSFNVKNSFFSDAAMKQFLLHLDETSALGRKFIIQDLDEKHLFISADILETLQAKVDDLMDQISFPLAEKGV